MIFSGLRSDLSSNMPIERVFQKHVVDGKSHYFSAILQDADAEYSLRHELADSLGVSINDVVIMGSAKIGFSVKTSKFSLFDSEFSVTQKSRDRSDIDIAIVNRDLFDKINREIYALSRHYDRIWLRENWRVNKFNWRPSDLHQRYALYLAKGWLRPDLMPLLYYQDSPWSKVCDNWRNRLSRTVSVGFYSDWHYLKNYQMDNLERLRSEISVMINSVVNPLVPPVSTVDVGTVDAGLPFDSGANNIGAEIANTPILGASTPSERT